MILLTAAVVIGWTAVWMKTHARDMVNEMRQVGRDVMAGKLPGISLSIIIGLAILREGSEIALFIYGMFASGQDASSIVLGSAVGVTLGTIAGVALYMGLIKMSAKYMLRVTGWLLVLLVAGLSSQAAGFLSAAGFFPHFSKPLWNMSWLLSDDSITGKAFRSLIGYTARPTPVELLFYAGALGIVLSCMNFAEKKHIMGKAMTTAASVAMFALMIVMPRPALALDEIYSPNAEPHEAAIEYNGSRTFDKDSSKDNAQEHELALEFGATDHVTLEASLGFAKDPGDDATLEDVELEGRYMFSEPGKNWVDTGVLLAYGFSTHSDDPDSLEAKLLLQKDTGRFTHTANIGFEQQVGDHASGGPDGAFLWNSRYRYSEEFQPGLELQSDLGSGATLHHFNEQEHYIGPAVWGRLFGHVRYQAALLRGVTDESSDMAARLHIEYETHF